MGTSRQEMHAVLNTLLEPQRFQDFAPNGLQVEGRENIETVVSGVTASQALINAAVALKADAILVHHGYFWRSEDPCLVGMKGRRVRTLMQAGINLFAYHLPLDCHPELGNNAGLGRALGVLHFDSLLSDEPTLPVFVGELPEETPLDTIANGLSIQLERSVMTEGDRLVKRIAWCTGGGQGYIDKAADAGADLFMTGEVSEQTIHIARERDIGFIAAGHHATERFGVQSVGSWLSQQLGVEHHFVDDDNPA